MNRKQLIRVSFDFYLQSNVWAVWEMNSMALFHSPENCLTEQPQDIEH